MRGDLNVIKFLVENRADVNAKDNMYDTQPYAFSPIRCLDYVFILVFTVEAPRCIGVFAFIGFLQQGAWTFASFS
jgi:hypothetical protein